MTSWFPLLSAKLRKGLLIVYTKSMKILGINPLINNLKILSPDELITVELGKLSYRYSNKFLPKRISNLFDMKHHTY